MANKELGELVRRAKGEDRSLREYAKDSGVDVAVISKIINGSYTPKKPDVFIKLTSPSAAPRGDVTYEQLVKAADSSKSFQAGIAAGLAATATNLTTASITLMALGPLPVATLTKGLASIAVTKTAKAAALKALEKQVSNEEELTYNGDALLVFEQKQKQFRAAALGIIVTTLAKSGISCTVKNPMDLNCFYISRPDECLVLPEHPISTWWFSFWSKDEKLDERALVFTPDRAHIMMSRYITVSADPTRKVSLVVDDPELFNEMVKFKDQNSYQGEMSAILVDMNTYSITKEEYIAHFNEEDTSNEFTLV